MLFFICYIIGVKTKILQFAKWASTLKNNKRTLLALIVLNALMGVISNVVDWSWLMSVEWYLRPFTPICSLYPLSLAIWYTVFLVRKKVPNWYTHFIFLGIVSYGIMAYIYYPVSMAKWGFDWRLFGNMLWVTTYALQSFVIVSELKKIPLYQFMLLVSYFVFKDYADRFLGTFIDIRGNDYPLFLKNFFGIVMISIHIIVFVVTRKINSLKAFLLQRFSRSKEKRLYSGATSAP